MMNKEMIPTGHAISIAVLFTVGTSIFMGVPEESGNSNWISVLLAMVLVVPLLLIYARLHLIFPGKDLFDMLIAVFGKVIGRFISCLYIWYAFHLGALVLNVFGEFSKTVALTETPMLAPMLCLGLLGVWVVKSGIEVLGRSAKLLLLFTVAVEIVILTLAISKLEYHYFLPLFDKGWHPVVSDTLGLFSFPFAEIVIFLGAFSSLSGKSSAKKILLGNVLISGVVILIVTLRNLLMLGPEVLSGQYFPSYVSAGRINVGDFLTRIEASSAVAFVITTFIKASVCLYVASIGLAKAFKLKSYRSVVLQIGLLMIYLADFVYKDIMEMQYFSYHIYKIYAFPFQVIIPLVLWICAEIKVSKSKNKQVASQQ
ncbi:endospore germination permease [Paenibacillus sp. FSL R5-0475]|uniref:GerAB/ArcD/ProY family transporter n=1 Tax=Paenibacillus sp. FSL R5-0475 TaxID=2921643 RepID=UPI0030F59387